MNHLLTFFAVFLGVLFGSLAKDYVEAELLISAISDTEIPRFETPLRYPEYETRSSPTPSKSGHKSGYTTALQTCEFWRSQYRQNPTSKAKIMMETACARAKSLE